MAWYGKYEEEESVQPSVEIRRIYEHVSDSKPLIAEIIEKKAIAIVKKEYGEPQHQDFFKLWEKITTETVFLAVKRHFNEELSDHPLEISKKLVREALHDHFSSKNLLNFENNWILENKDPQNQIISLILENITATKLKNEGFCVNFGIQQGFSVSLPINI